MLSLNALSMAYGARLLFDEVTLNFNAGSRYGLVGANGAGKSTFLRLLTGEEEPALGEITYQNNARVGWLRQDQFLYEDQTLVDTVLVGNPVLYAALKEKDALIAADHWTDEAGMRLGELEETIGLNDGYVAEDQARMLLEGLGLAPEKHDERMGLLSGGYKLRVLLAQALFTDPEVLLLDEPTNHLDLPSIEWLKSYLRDTFSGVLIFISHDQDFLESLATHILDIDYGTITCYTGRYKKYLVKKKEAEEQLLSERRNLEERIQQLQSFVDRFKAKASKARQAQSKQKMIDRIDIPEIKKSTRIAPKFAFTQTRASGKHVLTAKDVAKAFGPQTVLHDVSLKVARQDKVAITGANGMGKSTLLKILTDSLAADAGTVAWGHNVHWTYFAQEHYDDIGIRRQTALEWLEAAVTDKTQTEVRGALGAMLFSGDDAKKNVLTLSGGETTRLVFAKLMLQQGNVMLLDEPTNHMDLETINALIKALKRYEGTLIFVSHNRHFIEQVANRHVSITPKGLVEVSLAR